MGRKPIEFEDHPAPFNVGDAWRRAVGRYVVDGDTLDVMIDVGFLIYTYQTIRLVGVDASEIYGRADEAEKARGRVARERVAELAGPGRPLLVRSFKDRQTFGRYVAEVLYWHAERHIWLDLGETLVHEGHAQYTERKGA